MNINFRKYSHVWIHVLSIPLLFVVMLGLNTTQVSALNIKYDNIGVNDRVNINDDPNYYYTYLQFTPSKTGAITFSVTADEHVVEPIMLFKKDKSGKYVSFTDEFDNDFITNKGDNGKPETATYGVKKGEQYALRVENNEEFIINSKFKKVSESGGKKKSKAKNLKKGKATYGLLLMGKKASRWYKFKVPKTKMTTVEFNGWSNMYMCYSIMSKGNETLSRRIYKNNLDFNTKKNTSKENSKKKIMKAYLKKGSVIYIKVYNSSKEQSGYYKIKWKQ